MYITDVWCFLQLSHCTGFWDKKCFIIFPFFFYIQFSKLLRPSKSWYCWLKIGADINFNISNTLKYQVVWFYQIKQKWDTILYNQARLGLKYMCHISSSVTAWTDDSFTWRNNDTMAKSRKSEQHASLSPVWV